MTTEQRMAVLEAWHDYMSGSAGLYNKVGEVTSISPDTKFGKALFFIEGTITELVSDIVGDQHAWVNFFRYECLFGAWPLDVEFEGKEYHVANLQDLCHVIEETSKPEP